MKTTDGLSSLSWRHAASPLALIAFLLIAALFLAGCNDQSSPRVATAQTGQVEPSGPASAGSSNKLADFIAAVQKYVDCAREHGMPGLKDPDQFGRLVNFPPDGVSESVVHEVRTACTKLQVPPPPEVRKIWDAQYAATITPAQKKMFQAYADCMQANGAPDFPDPLPNGLDPETEWDQASAGGQHALATCEHIVRGPDSAP